MIDDGPAGNKKRNERENGGDGDSDSVGDDWLMDD